MSHPLTPIVNIDVDRHGGEEAPTQPIPKPLLGDTFELDASVIKALPVKGTEVLSARQYGMSLWGQTAKIFARLPNGEENNYFLKTVSSPSPAHQMISGEYESLKAIHAVSPSLVPELYAWGRYDQQGPETYFLLTQFRKIGQQPPDPVKFTAVLADMHKRSVSPTGRFGFHTTTCHAKLPQITDTWESSWSFLFQKQLSHMINLHSEKVYDDGDDSAWSEVEFQHLCHLTISKVVPRLLEPLQSNGRSIKPCLVHGDLWDENTATDGETGEPFIFDACSFFAHNEYEIGNWRAARHRLSSSVYVEEYTRNFPVSEPVHEWDDRNLLYSLRFDLGTAILIPGCNMRRVVKNNMTLLCRKYHPEELAAFGGSRIPVGC